MAQTKKTAKSNVNFSKSTLAIFVLVFGALGAYLIFKTSAATPTHTTFVNSSSAVVTGNDPITPTAGLVPVDSIGQQNVSILSSNAKLVYQQGVKGPLKDVCYFITVVPTKTSGSTATVEITSPTNYSTVNLDYTPTTPNSYQQVCVSSGKKTNPGFNVANLSPAVGPNIMVYQEALNW